MSEADSRKRILDMLAAGSISAEDAAKLLGALGGEPTPGTAPLPPRRRGTARSFRVSIDAFNDESGKERARVRVNVPIGLARFASRFLPPEAKRELESQGIDLAELLANLGDDVPEGPLVDLHVEDEGSGTVRARIIVEVV
jgi:hypothetical protein